MEKVPFEESFRPLFAESDSTDEDEPGGSFLPVPKIPISTSGSITASPIHELSKESLTLSIFQSEFKGKRPVLIKQCGVDLNFSEDVSSVSDKLSLWFSCEDHEKTVEVLVAKDDTNFLRHELCEKIRMQLGRVFHSIFSPMEGTKLYCRLYMDEYGHLKNFFDLQFLKILASTSLPRSELDLVCQPLHQNSAVAFEFKDANVGLWFSSTECITPLHFDLCHGFLCQVHGKKRFCMLAPEYTPYLYWRQTAATAAASSPIKSTHSINNDGDIPVSDILDPSSTRNGTSSYANVTAWLNSGPNEAFRLKYPLLSEVHWWVVDLAPGGNSCLTILLCLTIAYVCCNAVCNHGLLEFILCFDLCQMYCIRHLDGGIW